jgi:hypothetical protein
MLYLQISLGLSRGHGQGGSVFPAASPKSQSPCRQKCQHRVDWETGEERYKIFEIGGEQIYQTAVRLRGE